MGSVWLARRSDGRYEGEAAVKLLNLALLDPIGAERFRREGTLLARLGHPHIARLLDAGVAEGGQPYLVLERVLGERIDRYCDERRLSSDARIRLFLDVLAAVAHAHANLIVHRDLKPSNILVTTDGTVKLLDFGIATLLEEGGTGSTASTLTDVGGARALTPEYAAPEQVAGEPVTTATDVYSLGVLLYLLLAGRHPTGAGSRTAADHLSAVLNTVPPRLGAGLTPEAAGARSASAERLRRLYAGDLENIVAKALKKRPQERYLTVAAFAADLRRYLGHEPVTARPDSVWYRTRKFVRRNRGSVMLGAAVAAALITATVIAWTQLLAARRQRDEALFQARRAEATRDFQTGLISQIGTTRVSLRDLVDRGVASLVRRPPADPRVATALLVQLADRYAELDAPEPQRRVLAMADSAAALTGDARARALSSCALARYHEYRRQPDSIRILLARAAPYLEAGGTSGLEGRVSCLLAAAELASAEERRDSAVALGRLALEAVRETGGAGTLPYHVAQVELADRLRGVGRVREAIALLYDSRDGFRALGLEGSALAAEVDNVLALALSERGEHREAYEILREILARLAEADPGEGIHPAVGFNYASELVALGQGESALAVYRGVAASGRSRATLEVERRALIGVARQSAKLGRPAEAASALGRALALARTMQRPVARESLFVGGTIALANRDTARALADLEAVLRRDGWFEGKASRQSRAALADLTRLLLARRAPDRALPLARGLRDLNLLDSLAATRSADVGEANLLIARAHLGLGATDSARRYAAAALPALAFGGGSAHPLIREATALRDSLAP